MKISLRSGFVVSGILTTALFGFVGCSLPSSLQEAFGTETGRTRQLGERVTKFHKALNWGMPEQAFDFVAPEVQTSFVGMVTGQDDSGERRVIDIAVKNLEYAPEKNSDEAKVEAVVRFYRFPNMLVETNKTTEIWRYSRLEGGWRFTGIDENAGTVGGDSPATTVKDAPATIGGFMR